MAVRDDTRIEEVDIPEMDLAENLLLKLLASLDSLNNKMEKMTNERKALHRTLEHPELPPAHKCRAIELEEQDDEEDTPHTGI